VASKLGQASETGVIIDPAKYHFYQPGWTLVGGGIHTDKKETRKKMENLIPQGFKLVDKRVTQIKPDQNYVVLEEDGKEKVIKYDYLVVAAGAQINWDSVEGLADAVGKGAVATNYSYDHVDKTWEFVNNVTGGNAIFTQPSTPVKCAGAPQKIMYLAEEQFRKKDIRNNVNVKFFSGMGAIFSSPHYAKELTEICKQREIEVNLQHNLVAIRPDVRQAVFKSADGKEHVEKYDFIHVTPPMGPPNFIKNSALADSTMGWVEVNKETCQHVRYPNVFAVGDCSSAPKSRTAAAISQEAPVVAGNLLELMKGRQLTNKYTGYSSCPLITGRGKLILAEFDYSLKPKETFGFFADQSKEHWWAYFLKTTIMPPLYWYGLIRGYWNDLVSSKGVPVVYAPQAPHTK